MFDVFSSVKSLLKFDKVRIDDYVFKLHYKATVIILVLFSLLVTTRQYLGDPIDCIADEIHPKVMDTYCWIYSTYTLPSKVDGRIGKDVIHPGVGGFTEGEEPIKFHKYYQWVCFMLFFQAILFYIPRYIWKIWEEQRIKTLILGLDVPFTEAKSREAKVNCLVQFFLKSKNQDFYFYKYVFCQILNLVNVIGQIFLLDLFLDGEFSKYGINVVKFTEMDPQNREDPMSRVFPKVTKCPFNAFGPTGTKQTFDGLCVLPLNVINERLYVFLWFWFVILASVTALYTVYLLAAVMVPTVRQILMKKQLFNEKIKNLSKIAKEPGKWFILYQLGKNLDPLTYNTIVKNLAKELKARNRG